MTSITAKELQKRKEKDFILLVFKHKYHTNIHTHSMSACHVLNFCKRTHNNYDLNTY